MDRRTHPWRLVAAVLVSALGGTIAQAQQEQPAGASPEMQKLAFLSGKWTGTMELLLALLEGQAQERITEIRETT